MSQQGKVALVTGGARGIGRSFVEHLLAEGALVSICDVLKDVGEATAAELSKKYPEKIIFLQCDVTNDQQFEECFQNTIKKFSRLDIVINNAGIGVEWSIPFTRIVDINLNGVIRGSRLGLKYMSKEDGGHGGVIVNVGSIAASVPVPAVPVYSATKAAVVQYSRSLGHELYYNRTGVKVIAINPSNTETSMFNAVLEGLTEVPHLYDWFKEESVKYPWQRPESLGRGLITLLKTAENGTLWTIMNDEQPKPTALM